MTLLLENDFVAVLRRHLRFLAPDAELDWDRPLRDLGLNSLSSIDLLLELEEALDVQFADDQLSPESFATARSLWAATRSAAAAA